MTDECVDDVLDLLDANELEERYSPVRDDSAEEVDNILSHEPKITDAVESDVCASRLPEHLVENYFELVICEVRDGVKKECVILDIELKRTDVAKDWWVRQVRVIRLDFTGEIVEVEPDLVIADIDEVGSILEMHVRDAKVFDIKIERQHVRNRECPIRDVQAIMADRIE